MGISIEDHPSGVFVKGAIPDTPAQRAGFKSGDIILKIDNIPMEFSTQLIEYIRSKGVGNQVKIEFQREKKIQSIKLELEARPDDLSVINKKVLDTKIPKFKVVQVKNGQVFTQKEILNKVTILEFWATWCGPCVASHKELSRFAESEPEIAVLAVSDESTDIIKKYINKTQPKFITLRDEGSKLNRYFLVSAIPTTFVIDKKGIIRHVAIGSGKYQEEAFRKAKEYLLEN